MADWQARLDAHAEWGRPALEPDRQAFFQLVSYQVFKGACRACSGFGHDVGDKCATNTRIDARLRHMEGPFKAMWAAIKTATCKKGAREKGLAAYKTKAVVKASIKNNLKSKLLLGKRPAPAELDGMMAIVNEDAAAFNALRHNLVSH